MTHTVQYCVICMVRDRVLTPGGYNMKVQWTLNGGLCDVWSHLRCRSFTVHGCWPIATVLCY